MFENRFSFFHLKELVPHRKETLLSVFLAQVGLGHVRGPERLPAALVELQGGQAGPDVVAGLLAEGQEGGGVRAEPLAAGDVQEAAAQAAG